MEKENKIIGILDKLVPEEGVVSNIIEGVDLFRISNSSPRSPQKYEPSIIILAQGKKKVFIGDEIIMYDPLHYLALSIPLPLECETTATSDKPMLGLRIKVDATIVGEIVLDSDDSYHNYKPLPKGIYSAALDNNMLDAIVRLLKSLSSSSESKFLGPMIVREIIYRVLCNKKAEALRALAFRNQNFFKIARILDKIHEFFNKKFDLNKLAREAGMSISSFHATFKSVTNSSPLQYIKNVKLHKARLLMIEKGVNAYNAAYSVGYESPSQFNREYKRLFGITPGKEITV